MNKTPKIDVEFLSFLAVVYFLVALVLFFLFAFKYNTSFQTIP